MNELTKKLQQQVVNRLKQKFESSSGKTPEFAAFSSLFKKFLANGTKAVGLELASFKCGHFELSGFIKAPNGKLVYFSFGDVRSLRTSCQIMYRTAEHLKDFSGGPNNWIDTESPELFDRIRRLTE